MTKEERKYNNKTELALSALMFFSPLIQSLIKKNINITQSEENFIKGFIKLGYFNIILLTLSILLQIGYYISKNSFLQTISLVIIIILGIVLILGSIYAIGNKEIFKTNSDKEDLSKDKFDLLENLLYYIPIYNIYIWYKKHEFEKTNIILKESILLRTVFTTALIISSNENLILIILTIILIRILSIANGIGISHKNTKLIDNFFKKNPEEIRSYIKGTIITIFNKKSLKENIFENKQKFELILKIEYKQILLQYLILLIILLFLIYKGYINNNLNGLIAYILILSRYLLMIIKRKHVPNLPIIKEFSDLFFKNKI